MRICKNCKTKIISRWATKCPECHKNVNLAGREVIIVFALIIAAFVIPYITIPAFIVFLILWGFYKNSKISKKAKIIIVSAIGGLFAILLVWFGVAYASEPQPSLTITKPTALTTTIKAPQIIIQGTFSPANGKVEVNGQDIPASNGKFSTIYQLKQGENKIEVETGNLKLAYADLTINRESSITITPTPTAKPTTVPVKKTKNTPTPTATPTPIPTLSVSEKTQVVAVITANTNHFKQLWNDGLAALGTTQYDAYDGLDALNDPNSNAYKFSQYQQKENPANDNSMNDALTQADKFYPSNVSDDALNNWRMDMIQLSSDMGLWVNDATSWQIKQASTSKLDSDEQTVEKDFSTVQQDIQAIN
jgi:energy-coupling factor transporter transmembrane protein EcfT